MGRGCQLTLITLVISVVMGATLILVPGLDRWIGVVAYLIGGILSVAATWLLSSPRSDGAWLHYLRVGVRLSVVVLAVDTICTAVGPFVIEAGALDASRLAVCFYLVLRCLVMGAMVVRARYFIGVAVLLGDRALRKFFVVVMWVMIVLCVVTIAMSVADWQKSLAWAMKPFLAPQNVEAPSLRRAIVMMSIFVILCLAYAWAFCRMWRRLRAVASGAATICADDTDTYRIPRSNAALGEGRIDGTLTPVSPEERAALVTRRARRRNTIVFVLFLVVAMGGGMGPPVIVVSSDQGRRLVFSFFSCMGVLGALYAVIVFLRHRRLPTKPPRLSRILGIIGTCGLVFGAIHGLTGPLVARVGPLEHTVDQPRWLTASSPSFGHTQPHEWIIDGDSYNINTTYWTAGRMGGRDLSFFIKYSHLLDNVVEEAMTDEQAMAIAFPLIQHAYETGLYAVATTRTLSGREYRPSRMTVSVIYKIRGERRTQYQYVLLSVDDIQRRLSKKQSSSLPNKQ